MPVSYQHEDYDAMLPKWCRCRDASKGQDAIHKAGTKYLPQLSEQTTGEYDAYKNRTPFYNATWRTIDGLRGMLFRKPPQLDVPETVQKMLKDVTLAGESFHIFSLNIAEEALTLGRVGILVDYPTVDTNNATMADALEQNFRPSMKMYMAESIINWKTKVINNASVLSMVVLAELKATASDEFADDFQSQWRVLDLLEVPTASGKTKHIYRVRVYIQNEKKEDVLVSTAFPQINGKEIEEIPFQFIGVDSVDWNIDEPPLIDLVDMNLSHYRTSADYEHGCHFTGLPTPVVSGYTPEQQADGSIQKFCIGSMTAWVFPRPEAKASFLEFKGEGLGALEHNLGKKENYMAVLGARMLESQARAVESANTASIHRGGEQSMLASVAQSVSIGLTKALVFFSRFAGAGEKVKIELNRDFFPVPMDALTLTAIIAGWQNGAYSYDTMFENLKKGEIVPVERTAEEEQAAVKANPAPLPGVGTTPGSASPNAPKTAASGTGADKTITQLQHP